MCAHVCLTHSYTLVFLSIFIDLSVFVCVDKSVAFFFGGAGWLGGGGGEVWFFVVFWSRAGFFLGLVPWLVG